MNNLANMVKLTLAKIPEGYERALYTHPATELTYVLATGSKKGVEYVNCNCNCPRCPGQYRVEHDTKAGRFYTFNEETGEVLNMTPMKRGFVKTVGA